MAGWKMGLYDPPRRVPIGDRGDYLPCGRCGERWAVIWSCLIGDDGAVAMMVPKNATGLPVREAKLCWSCTIEYLKTTGVRYVALPWWPERRRWQVYDLEWTEYVDQPDYAGYEAADLQARRLNEDDSSLGATRSPHTLQGDVRRGH